MSVPPKIFPNCTLLTVSSSAIQRSYTSEFTPEKWWQREPRLSSPQEKTTQRLEDLLRSDIFHVPTLSISKRCFPDFKEMSPFNLSLAPKTSPRFLHTVFFFKLKPTPYPTRETFRGKTQVKPTTPWRHETNMWLGARSFGMWTILDTCLTGPTGDDFLRQHPDRFATNGGFPGVPMKVLGKPTDQIAIISWGDSLPKPLLGVTSNKSIDGNHPPAKHQWTTMKQCFFKMCVRKTAREKYTSWNSKMEVDGSMIFLFSGVIFRFQPFIFRGVSPLSGLESSRGKKTPPPGTVKASTAFTPKETLEVQSPNFVPW